MDTSYRPAVETDAEAVSKLVKRALLPHTLPGWTPAAIARAHDENSPQELRDRLNAASFAHVCTMADSVVGFIISKNSRLLSLLAVDPSHQRSGVGSQLLRLLFSHVAERVPDVSVIEVNATEYSLPFYRRSGFHPVSEFIDFEGCRFIRMGFWRSNPSLSKRER